MVKVAEAEKKYKQKEKKVFGGMFSSGGIYEDKKVEEKKEKAKGDTDSEGGEEDEDIPEDLATLVKMFPESDSFEKIILLAVVNHAKYSRETLVKHFGCTRYQIDQARKLQKENSGLSLPKKLIKFQNSIKSLSCLPVLTVNNRTCQTMIKKGFSFLPI